MDIWEKFVPGRGIGQCKVLMAAQVWHGQETARRPLSLQRRWRIAAGEVRKPVG